MSATSTVRLGVLRGYLVVSGGLVSARIVQLAVMHHA
jgi:hypothetical protein